MERPRVSVVVPARGAASTLAAAVQSALAQKGARIDEVILAVAAGDDPTRAVAEHLRRVDSRVRVVRNARGTTPAALNTAIEHSTGEVVVRLDAHAVIPTDYVATAVAVLCETGAGTVGGRQVPTAETGTARVIATAMRSPLGAGGATYRSGTKPGPAETVYLGVFRRVALEAVGGFDERLLRNQDYELNHRLRRAGWEVWFDPRLAVRYEPRDSFRGLARQYADYGRFKRLVVREHPSSLRLRQVLPLAMVAAHLIALVVGAVLGVWWLPVVVVAGYVTALVLAGALVDLRRAPGVAAALATMHWSWALGFVLGPGAVAGSPRGAGSEMSDAGSERP